MSPAEEPGVETPPRSLAWEALPWLGAAGLSLVSLALAAGWWPMTADEISLAQRSWTSWVYGLVMLWLAVAWTRVLWSRRNESVAWRGTMPAVVAVLAGGLWLQAHEPSGWRVLFDEPGHAATAYAMWQEGSAESVSSCHLGLEGETLARYQPSQRMGLYPYLGSLWHGLAGNANPSHLILLNALLGFVFLGAGAALGQRMAGRAGALWFVAALTFLPMTAQLATSGSYDLLYSALLLLLAGQMCAWWARPTPARLSLLFALGAALVLCRYEGVLMLGAVGLLTWFRQGRAFRPGVSLPLAALALIPSGMVARVFLWVGTEKYGQESSFGLKYIPGNLAATFKHLCVPMPGAINCALLGWAGLIGWGALLWRNSFVRKQMGENGLGPVPALFGGIFLVYVFVVATSFWSSPDDPITSRLMLPVWIGMAYGAVLWLGRLPAVGHLAGAGVLAAWLLFFQMPSWSRHAATHSFLVAPAVKAYTEFAKRMPPRSLFLYDNPGTLGVNGFSAGIADIFDQKHQRTAGVVAAGHYDHVYTMIFGLWRTGPDGKPTYGYSLAKNISQANWEIVFLETVLLPRGHEAHFAEIVGWKDDKGVVHPMKEMPPGSVPRPGMTPGQITAWRLEF